MQIFLFLIFIAVPIIEIALFIEAGRTIGVVATIAITIGTAIAGSFLMRVQGFATLSRFTQAIEKGEMPVMPVIDGIGILAAGLLLLTPGLFTDTIGLLLFVPPIRRGLAKWAFERAKRSGRVQFRTFGRGGGDGGRPRPGGPSPGDAGFTKSADVVDAEFETVDPKDGEDGATPLDRDRGAPGKGRTKSPWRRG
jgi:UPF0716 protein FxsA